MRGPLLDLGNAAGGIPLTHRGDSPSEWARLNPVLARNEIGVEETQPGLRPRIKIGDGVTRWRDLPYGGGNNAPAQAPRGPKGLKGDAGDPAPPLLIYTLPLAP